MGIERTRNKRWIEVDRIEQCASSGVLVIDLRRFHKQQMDDRLKCTKIVYKNTFSGPRALEKKINEVIRGLRFYGKRANKNKFVVRHLFWTRP